MGFAKSPTKFIYTICDDSEEEEDFQTVALDDDHWIADPVPDRHLCIHNICSHILCVANNVCIVQIPPQYHTMTHWISVTFLTLRM